MADVTIYDWLSLFHAEDVLVATNLAVSTVIFWDYCITFGDEVELIWRPKWTLMHILFCTTRYLTMGVRIVDLIIYTDVLGLIHITISGCRTWMLFDYVSGHIVYTAVEFLLVMRVYAFYGRNRNLLTILLLLFFGERGVATAVYIVRLPGVDMAVSEIPPPIHSGLCATMNSNAVFYLYWIPGAVVESVLFLLLIGMFVRVKRCTGMSSPRLLVVFVRDGAWAFTVIFAAMLWCSFTFRFDFARGDIATTWMFSAAGLCGSRLILNLCTVAREHVWITSNIHQLHTMPWITTD